MRVNVNIPVQVNAISCHSTFDVHQVMTEQLFNAIKAIKTLASGAMKVCGVDCLQARRPGPGFGPYHSGSPGPDPLRVHKPS